MEYNDKGLVKSLVEAFWNEECPQINMYKKYPLRLAIVLWVCSVTVIMLTSIAVYLCFHFLAPTSPLFMRIMMSFCLPAIPVVILILILFPYYHRMVYRHFKHIKKSDFGDIIDHEKYLSVFQSDVMRARVYNWILCQIADYEVTRIKSKMFSDGYYAEEREIRREYRSTIPPQISLFDDAYSRHLRSNSMKPGTLADIIHGILPKAVGSTMTSTTKSAESSV